MNDMTYVIPEFYLMNQKEIRAYFIHLIVLVNKRVVKKTKEPHLVQDIGKLESAVNSAYYSETDLERAARMLKGIVMAHAFLQGNKRTAFVVANVMLGRKPKITVHQMSKKIRKWEIETIMKKL